MRRLPITLTASSTPEPAPVRYPCAAPLGPKSAKAGIVVVRASRTGSGVAPVDDSQPGLVADSLNPAKARILLDDRPDANA